MKVTLKDKGKPQQFDMKHLKMILAVGGSLKKWQKQAKNTKQRLYILNQWISTERSYIQDLKIIEKNIQKPLIDSKLITPDQQRILFPNLKSMIDLSERLTKCLEEVKSSWHPHNTLIGERLKGYYKFFIIYRQVTTVFMKSQAILKELKTLPEVQKIEKKLSLDLESYIIKPVQRPPKYQLLLRQYSKALRRDHQDYQKVKEAMQKYHEVNELNNQSMDKQIRAKAMISLDKKFGGIISGRFGRQYLKEFSCSSFDAKCQIHTFNDMLIVLKKNNQETDTSMWKRILLDHTSYVKIKNNQKYHKNLVFVCGCYQSVHLQFESPADRSLFAQNIQEIITGLKEREEEKKRRFSQNEMKRNNSSKFKVTKWHEDLAMKIKYNVKMEITVEATSKPRGTVFYLMKFKLIDPFSIHQAIIITQDKMEEIQAYLTLKYPSLYFPKVTHNTQAIGFYDTTKNRTQIIEHRSCLYEECLNYIFRNEDFYLSWKPIATMIGLNNSLFQFASSQALTCRCSLCLELKDNCPLNYYIAEMNMLKKHRKVIKSKLTWFQNNKVGDDTRQTALSQRSSTIAKNLCSNRYFQLIDQIRRRPADYSGDYNHKMISLEAHLGNIDYSMLEPQESTNAPLVNASVRIRLLSIEQEFIDITLHEDKYVRDIIQEIGVKNSLENVFDWGLFLIIDNSSIQIPQDQKILSFGKKWGINIVEVEQGREQQSFLIQRLQGIKKISDILFGASAGAILFKKWIYLQPQVQIDWCKNNKERYSFLINQIYGRIKIGDIKLSYTQVVELSACYLLRIKFEKVPFFNAENIDTQPLKDFLPGNYWPYFTESGFKMELFLNVKDGFEKLNQLENKRNGIQIIYGKTLEALKGTSSWINRNFTLSTYHGSQDNDVLVSVNIKRFRVTSKSTSEKILGVNLEDLKYRVTTFSLFVIEDSQEFRFDGVQVGDIKHLIQTYRVYRCLQNQTNQ